MNTRAVNYLWVGNPTKTDPNAIAGHDVAGPIQMARELERQGKLAKNPVKFWCLEEHAAVYRKQFEEAGVKIEVCTIEDVIKKEEKGELASRAAFVKGKLALAKSPDVKERVKFKDMFSLFLMVSEGGYFLDTNVAPIEGQKISLDGTKTAFTANNPDGKNDFYIMYSPKRGDANMKAVFDEWIKTPKISNFMAFEGKGVQIVHHDEIKAKMGIVKASYKSYLEELKVKGLFYWFDHKKFAEKIPYGDINIQIKYPGIKLLGGDCGLYKKDSAPTPADLPANVSQGFFEVKSTVMVKPPIPEGLSPEGQAIFNRLAKVKPITIVQIYYVNKHSNTVVCVHEAEQHISPFNNNDVFNFKEPKLASPSDIAKIIDASTDKTIYPVLENIGGHTLLHHAVLMNDIDKVKLLLAAGAKLDLTAQYQVKSQGKTLTLTPQGLAEYLGHGELIALLEPKQEKKSGKVKKKVSQEAPQIPKLPGKEQLSSAQVLKKLVGNPQELKQALNPAQRVAPDVSLDDKKFKAQHKQALNPVGRAAPDINLDVKKFKAQLKQDLNPIQRAAPDINLEDKRFKAQLKQDPDPIERATPDINLGDKKFKAQFKQALNPIQRAAPGVNPDDKRFQAQKEQSPDIFAPIEQKPIGLDRAAGFKKVYEPDTVFYYTSEALPYLLKDEGVAKEKVGSQSLAVLRFLLTTDNKLIIAHEGRPSSNVPAHYQMADMDVMKAKCLTAGNLYFNEKGELCRINNKSGDFRPPFDSLQFLIPELKKLGIPIAKELEIEKLNSSGTQVEVIKVKTELLFKQYGEPKSPPPPAPSPSTDMDAPKARGPGKI